MNKQFKHEICTCINSAKHVCHAKQFFKITCISKLGHLMTLYRKFRPSMKLKPIRSFILLNPNLVNLFAHLIILNMANQINMQASKLDKYRPKYVFLIRLIRVSARYTHEQSDLFSSKQTLINMFHV